MLDKRGAVMEAARRISSLLRARHITGAVIGGVAVVLHGHVRTTRDVDVFVAGSTSEFRPILEAEGASFNASRKEFLVDEIPVHLVGPEMALPTPTHFVDIEDVATVSLADLINLKLHSGTRNVTRAQDIADVIGLIRFHSLNASFASKIQKSLRPEFRKLVAAVKKER